MPTAVLELQRMNLVYGQRQVEEAHTQHWFKVRDDGYDAILNERVDPVSLSDREEILLDWLEDYGVKQAWKLAEPLAQGGVEVETLNQLMERWRNDSTELREMGLHWLALSFEVISMIKHGLRGAERISELVQAMKSYSYLDQGIQQEVNLHQGLEDTLRLFCHKLKYGIQVQRHYDRQIPKILAYGSELNQVWTNLIDNAIDAMDGKGLLEITTQQRDRFVRVDISDSGSGIPSDIQTRIFEPFFTTKSVGQGSGLGLETARRIVENRHHGTISFESNPGRTCFTICLPLPNQ
jgi:signal transduction histidine kinase